MEGPARALRGRRAHPLGPAGCDAGRDRFTRRRLDAGAERGAARRAGGIRRTPDAGGTQLGGDQGAAARSAGRAAVILWAAALLLVIATLAAWFVAGGARPA